jgi:DNA-binding response OmpR family regulator
MISDAKGGFSDDIRRSYALRLKERRAEFENILQRLLRDAAHLTDFDTLERECHKLSGSGATYGFPDITDTAVPLNSKLRSGSYKAPEIAALLSTLLAAMDAVIGFGSDSTAEPDCVVEDVGVSTPSPAAYRPMILIADDDPEIRDLLVELLVGMAVVQCASTGNEVLEAVKITRFDVIVLDHNMPDMDGHQILSNIKPLIDASQTAVMMLTASGDAGNVAKLLQAGARDYVIKPFYPHSLLRRIQALIDMRSPLVLLADDDPLIRAIIRTKLQQRGVKVLLASNGTEALTMARQSRPHVVILDRAMPRMDGLDVLRAIRKDSSTRMIPVVVLSARRAATDISEGMRCGASDYIPKPFLPDALVSRCLSLMRVPARGAAA